MTGSVDEASSLDLTDSTGEISSVDVAAAGNNGPRGASSVGCRGETNGAASSLNFTTRSDGSSSLDFLGCANECPSVDITGGANEGSSLDLPAGNGRASSFDITSTAEVSPLDIMTGVGEATPFRFTGSAERASSLVFTGSSGDGLSELLSSRQTTSAEFRERSPVFGGKGEDSMQMTSSTSRRSFEGALVLLAERCSDLKASACDEGVEHEADASPKSSTFRACDKPTSAAEIGSKTHRGHELALMK